MMKITNIVLISKNKMMTKALELCAKDLGIQFFSIDSLDESLHFIADLEPDVILFEEDGFEVSDFDKLVSSTQIPVVSIGETVRNRYVAKPVDPMTFFDDLGKLFL